MKSHRERAGQIEREIVIKERATERKRLVGVGEERGCHEGHELGELHKAVVGVGPLGECLELLGIGLEPDQPEERAELELGEAAVSVLVEGAKDLAELRDLVLVQLHRSSTAGSGPPRPKSEIDREQKEYYLE
ncbi:hypothetical protein CRG98_010818 [Punica granatum]|uniref:Uncharacterized protein n=1 Tax=Punica granatum TaxID=22663 RepID=A0A2I0KJU8_PUNGR|nr:hypothetical protein CRG98_010818 [Punica granatum]